MKPTSRRKAAVARRAILCLAAFVLATALSACDWIPEDASPTLPGLESEITTEPDASVIAESTLWINEVSTSNVSTLTAFDSSTPDWIELHNAGPETISLEGYSLSDNLKKPGKLVLPDISISAGGYLVIFASGREGVDANGSIHAPFRLDSDGDDVVLTSPAGQIISYLEIPKLPADVSYGLAPAEASQTGQRLFFGDATPGEANSPDGKPTAEKAIVESKADLVINEYMTANKSIRDLDGDLPDWIEIRNMGSEAINLKGFSLSDNADNLDKWIFPDIDLEPGGFLLIWLSGKDITSGDELHADFGLGSDDTLILISDPSGRLVSQQFIEDLPDNISRGRSPDVPGQWLYFPLPTPGEDNTTQGFAEIAGAMTLDNRGLWINEVLAVDAVVTTRGKTSEPDWIELRNGTDEAISLAGYGLSDRADDPYRMVLSDLTIQPGQYLVIQPSGFGISPADETLYLTNADGRLVDWFDAGTLRNAVSSGRGSADEAADTRYFYTSPTPGKANAAQAATAIAADPVISVISPADDTLIRSIYFAGEVLVQMTSVQPGAVLRYTLDGSEPDSSSQLYSEPLAIDSSSAIRCKAFVEGELASNTTCRTILAEIPHDLPVVAIAIRPADFTGSFGVWSDYTRDHEAPCQVSFYETDGTLGTVFNAGLALHGSFSRKEAQKSMELNLREFYGDSQVIYPFFPDNEVSTFKRLILRTSGQDWRYSKLRDAFMSEVIEDDLETDTMDWRPCVVYVNGEYYGLYAVRENIDEYYMAAHFGTDPDNTDIIKGNNILLEGSRDAWHAFLGYVRTHSMTDPESCDYVLSQMDELSFMDWIIAESFFSNLDSGNKKFWRENTEGQEWRWAFFDLDWGMFPTTYTRNSLKYDLLDPDGHGAYNIFDTTLQVKLLQNPEFKTMFIERYAELINTVFQTDRMLTILDDMTLQISSEIPRQVERWGKPNSVAFWEDQVAKLRRITSEKRERMIVNLQQTFNLSSDRMAELFPEDF